MEEEEEEVDSLSKKAKDKSWLSVSSLGEVFVTQNASDVRHKVVFLAECKYLKMYENV
jgi:hypothetical protein